MAGGVSKGSWNADLMRTMTGVLDGLDGSLEGGDRPAAFSEKKDSPAMRAVLERLRAYCAGSK